MTQSRFYRLVPLFAIAIALVAGLATAVRPAAAAIGPPDLTVSMAASRNPVGADTPLYYTLKVYNTPEERCYQQGGEDRCTFYGRSVSGVVVDFAVPAGATYRGASGNHGFSCAAQSAALVRCVNGSLLVQDEATIYISIYAPTAGGTATATAKVDPANAIAERSESNNTASAPVTVNPLIATDLAVTSLTAAPNPASRNGTVTFTVTVKNVSAREAQGVSVTLKAVPASSALHFTSGGDANLWSCYPTSDQAFDVFCHGAGSGCEIVCYGSIPAGGSVTLTITATAMTAGPASIGLQANVAVAEHWGYVDVNAANNSRTMTLVVQ